MMDPHLLLDSHIMEIFLLEPSRMLFVDMLLRLDIMSKENGAGIVMVSQSNSKSISNITLKVEMKSSRWESISTTPSAEESS